MAINNTITLIGNTGSEVRIIESEGKKPFAAVSIATTDSYKDQDDKWQDKETLWHNIIAFSPSVIEQLKAFKKGTRLQITGSLSYRDFKVLDEGKEITKKEAQIIAYKVEQAPLVKKNQDAA
jgi:single-strand DNA-binding protein